MYISWNWLNRHVDLSGLDPHVVGEEFTLKCAELEGVEEIGGGLDKFRTVRVEAVAPVEGSDHLTQVTVQDGEGTVTVVCGAPNAKESVGCVAVLAPAGCTLPDGTEIKQATIRGVESSGMLASEKELGLSDNHDGILLFDSAVTPGQALPQAVPVHDFVWEVDNKAITHRPDLWGHRGIAREVALLVGRKLKPLDYEPVYGSEDRVEVVVDDPDLCPRYCAAYFTGVRIESSPQWMQCLLRATGIRPISNVVDFTNFVMLDVGNPMHAFDAKDVSGNKIVVRRAEDGEIVKTLDGQDRKCDADTLLICDAERPVAIAGVMGGENSEISPDTHEVILEAANFNAGNVRKTSVRLGLRTDASARFEKALDPVGAAGAARLFTHLMESLIEGCKVVSPLVDVAARMQTPPAIRLHPDAVSERLGIDVPIGQIRSVLMGLGFQVQDRSSGELHVLVPSWRATRDVSIPEDLIEEIGRVHGYLNIPPKPPRVLITKPQRSKGKEQDRAARRYLSAGCGMHEVLSYAFTWKPMLERLGADLGGRLIMANTISADMDRMRRSLVPNLLKFAEENSRYYEAFGLYEVGRAFQPIEGELPNQNRHVTLLVVHPDDDTGAEAQYRQLRGTVDGLLADVGAPDVTYRRPTADEIGWRAAWVHPKRSAVVSAGGIDVGYITLLHPRAAKVLDDIKGQVALAEIDLDVLLTAGEAEPRYEAVPKYPGIGFDVSFEVTEAVTADALVAEIRAGLKDWELLRQCALFDNYHLGDGKKSVSFHLDFRSDERSLKDKEVHKRVKKMIKHVEGAVGASLRGG